MPSVTMNGGNRYRAINVPFVNPITAPRRMPIVMPGTIPNASTA